MLYQLKQLLFPPKCILCRTLLDRNQTDLCHTCRTTAPEFTKGKIKFSFLARWTAVWYYKDTVRKSLLRYKFSGVRSYADAYGRLLAMHLVKGKFDDFDILTWVPVGPVRRRSRGYDQVELIAAAVARELNVPLTRTLKKIRNTPPQSGIPNAARRRANVLNAYQAVNRKEWTGKRILLLDDIITTGATASECAKTLLIAGAKEVCCAAVAVAAYEKDRK